MSENETDKPVFSIITPTNNRPALLRRAILSIRNQTFKDYEHIIVDDANNKETTSLINSFSNQKIIYYRHDAPRGAGGAYNTGIKLSRGRFILFLDDDDEYLPSLLEKMHECFLKGDKKLGFVWTGFARIKDTNTEEKLLFTKIWPSQFQTKEQGLVEATSIGNGYGVCIKRECIEKVGLYDESLTFGQDTDFLFRLAENFDFETIPEVLVKIHQHDNDQLTDKKNNLIRLEFRKKMLEKNKYLLMKFPELYYIHYKVVADLSYRLGLKRSGRKTMISIIKRTSFRMLNLTDLFFYELFGIDTRAYYNISKLKRIVQFLKRKSS